MDKLRTEVRLEPFFIEATQHVRGQYQCICCLVNLGDTLLPVTLRSLIALEVLIHSLCSFKATW